MWHQSTAEHSAVARAAATDLLFDVVEVQATMLAYDSSSGDREDKCKIYFEGRIESAGEGATRRKKLKMNDTQVADVGSWEDGGTTD